MEAVTVVLGIPVDVEDWQATLIASLLFLQIVASCVWIFGLKETMFLG